MTKAEFALRLKRGCASVAAAEGELTEIDSHFGDADHGLTMSKIAKAISNAVEGAEGAEASKGFVSKFGRAKSYGEKTIGTPDAGAMSMSYFFQGLAQA